MEPLLLTDMQTAIFNKQSDAFVVSQNSCKELEADWNARKKFSARWRGQIRCLLLANAAASKPHWESSSREMTNNGGAAEHVFVNREI